MQHLRVSVKAGSALALPVEIYSPKGSLIGSGAVSSRFDKVFEFPCRKRVGKVNRWSGSMCSRNSPVGRQFRRSRNWM